MFKALVLQHLYDLSDEQLEFHIRDRMTFCRFLGLTASHSVPDAKTIWWFREKLVSLGLMKQLFEKFDKELASTGYEARKGQIVDASIVEVPRQRHNKEDNKTIKAGGRPDSFDENKNVGAQKDVDDRWTKKNKETYFAYKDHVVIDNDKKLIRSYEVTSAEVQNQMYLNRSCRQTHYQMFGQIVHIEAR